MIFLMDLLDDRALEEEKRNDIDTVVEEITEEETIEYFSILVKQKEGHIRERRNSPAWRNVSSIGN